MNTGKIKKYLRKDISKLPEKKQTRIKNVLFKASLENLTLFDKLVTRTARKRVDLAKILENACPCSMGKPCCNTNCPCSDKVMSGICTECEK